MEEFIVTRLAFCVTTLMIATAGEEATGICCNNATQTWREAVSGCRYKNEYLACFDTGIGKTVAQLSLRSDVNIWTAEYARKSDIHDHRYQILCGYSYLNNTSLSVKEELFGRCDIERYYICKDGARNLTVYQSKKWEIINDCQKTVTLRSLILNKGSIRPGFYWTNNVLPSTIVSGRDVPTPDDSVLCGAYTQSIGQYFINCNSKRASLCMFDGKTDESCDKSCFGRPTASTTITLTTPVKIVGTTVKQTDKTTETFNRTDKTTATVKGTVKTTKTYNETDKTTGTFNRIDKTTGTFNETVTHSIDERGRDNDPQSTRHQPVTQPISTKHRTKIQDHRLEEQKGEKNDAGVEIGLPVGLCLVLIIGIIFSIYLSRRYKCFKTKTDSNTNSNRNTDRTGSSKSSTGRVLAHFNASYEANEDIDIVMEKHDEKKNVSKYLNRHKKHRTDPSSEYAVVHKYNVSHSNQVQAAEYSFAKEIWKEEDNDGEGHNIREDDYDVTGNFLSCTSDNIYNHLQGEEYDSSANVKRGDICNNDYGITQSKDSQSVYDSARQVNDSSPCDNIYNKLSQDTDKEKQSCYDSTLNISKTGKVKDTDQTYDKLR